MLNWELLQIVLSALGIDSLGIDAWQVLVSDIASPWLFETESLQVEADLKFSVLLP